MIFKSQLFYKCKRATAYKESKSLRVFTKVWKFIPSIILQQGTSSESLLVFQVKWQTWSYDKAWRVHPRSGNLNDSVIEMNIFHDCLIPSVSAYISFSDTPFSTDVLMVSADSKSDIADRVVISFSFLRDKWVGFQEPGKISFHGSPSGLCKETCSKESWHPHQLGGLWGPELWAPCWWNCGV